MQLQSSLSLSKLDFPENLVWQGTESDVVSICRENCDSRKPWGQFAVVVEDSQFIYLCRDRIGSNKLFYHVAEDSGRVTAGHFLCDVAQATGDVNAVKSLTAGHHARIEKDSGRVRLTCYSDLSAIQPDPNFDASRFSGELDRKLTSFFMHLAERFPERQFFVCLSGGLDSTIIATYARRYLGNVTAVTFSYESLSDDYRAARSIAAALELPFHPVVIKRELEETVLDEVLLYGQDWRDFNVHCAWVNYHIARQLRNELGGEPAIVLTGDLMNEFVADYSAEEFDGATYYRLPKVSRGRLRRFLVYGLDAGDREVGVFHRWGLTLIQPFSVLAEDYLAVPPELLDSEDAKRNLNLALVDPRAIGHLLAKKTRAQIGSSDGGTLGLFHQSGIGQEDLRRRWTELLLPCARDSSVQPVIVSGRYRN